MALDIFLYTGEANPSDVRLRDPTTAAPSTYTATLTATTAPVLFSASAAFAKPTYTATLATTVGHATFSASATFTAPVYTGALAATTGHATFSAAATFTAPVYTATASLTVGHATFAGSAAFTKPVYTGSLAASVGHATFSAAATFATAAVTGTLAATIGAPTFSGGATSTPPHVTRDAGEGWPLGFEAGESAWRDWSPEQVPARATVPARRWAPLGVLTASGARLLGGDRFHPAPVRKPRARPPIRKAPPARRFVARGHLVTDALVVVGPPMWNGVTVHIEVLESLAAPGALMAGASDWFSPELIERDGERIMQTLLFAEIGELLEI